ncbi:MAG: VOC family protein [Persicimonas sp.]
MLEGKLQVMLYVSDLERSVEFYRDRLGFGFSGYWDDATDEVVEDWDDVEEPGYAEVTVGEDSVGLHPDPDFEPGRTRIKISFTVDDVDAIYEAAVADGVVEATEPEDFPWGARMFTITDPDGHEIDFVQPLEG